MTAEHDQRFSQKTDTTKAQNPCQHERTRSTAIPETWIRTEKGEVWVKREIAPGITTVSKMGNSSN